MPTTGLVGFWGTCTHRQETVNKSLPFLQETYLLWECILWLGLGHTAMWAVAQIFYFFSPRQNTTTHQNLPICFVLDFLWTFSHCLCWQNYCLLSRWDGKAIAGSVVQGAFSVPQEKEAQSRVLQVPNQQLSQLSWEKNIHIPLLAVLYIYLYLKSMTKCFNDKYILL